MALSNSRRIALALAVLTASAILPNRVHAQEAAKPEDSATKTQAAPNSQRGMREIMQDFQAAQQQMQGVINSPTVFTDPAKRKEAGPKAVPPMKKMLGYARELRNAKEPQGKMLADQIEPQLQTFLVLFGDKDTRADVEKQAKDADKDRAASAKGILLMSDWVEAGKDSDAQQKLLPRVEEVAKEGSASDSVTQELFMMSELGSASPELTDKVQTIVASMQSRSAQQIKQQVESQRKLRSMENKPLTIEGVKNDGKAFTSADWKGKVILVDFWATWCGPCRAELPRVKKAYADWHEKGLEILGVSCDNSGDDLKKCLDENKDMPWPQLFEEKTAGWHPLAKQYGINGIPTMFLIDKKGVLRSVTARENFEEMIPKLLEEK